MTVAELIAELSKHPPGHIVHVPEMGMPSTAEARRVTAPENRPGVVEIVDF
jgi:hypothetical protein